jgi:hypothetical protein
MKQVVEVINELKEWERVHTPYDRTTRLNLFQFVIEEGTGGKLVPLSTGLEKQETEAIQMPNLNLSDHAFGQYLNRLGYPAQLFKRLPGKLNIMNLNWLSQFGGYDKDVLVRVQDNSIARALMSKVYQPFDTLELLELAEPFMEGAVVRWHYDDKMTFHLSVSFPNYAEEIRKGDIIERGFHVSNSEVGIRSVRVAGYTHRLVCTNGAISRGEGDSFNFRHTGDHDQMRDMIRTAIEASKLETERIIAQFKNALNVKVEEPFDFLQKTFKENNLTVEQFRASLNELMGSQDKDNLFGISQSISGAAKGFEGEKSYEMQRLSVEITDPSRILSLN